MKTIICMVAMLVVLGGAVDGSTARADLTVTCSVGQVAWTEYTGPTFQINCGGTWYYGFGSGASCPEVSSDERRAWLTLAEDAHLSGTQITLKYVNCTGGPGLIWVSLQ